MLTVVLLAGCTKKNETVSTGQTPSQPSAAPAPSATPSEPVVVEQPDNGDIDALLARLTHELHKTMVGRRMKRDFDEFVAIRNLKVPPPPAGKKYAIDSHWKVILVNQ